MIRGFFLRAYHCYCKILVIPHLFLFHIICQLNLDTESKHIDSCPPSGAIVAFMGFGWRPLSVFTLVTGEELHFGGFPNRSSISICIPLAEKRNMELHRWSQTILLFLSMWATFLLFKSKEVLKLCNFYKYLARLE